MQFNKHFDLAGKHAFLSASKYHWVNYSDEKLDESYRTSQMARLGTRLHAFASEAISLGIKMRGSSQTLPMYVNDAIGFRMTPEQVLYYSDYAFGTADAISYRNGLLRIHDLKTGVTPSSMTQLEIYTALFCLEYGFKPSELEVELRIYQNDEVIVHSPEVPTIVSIMDKIVTFDKRIQLLESEARL